MKKFLLFLAVGSFFATVEEYLTIVVLRGDVPSYVFTLIVLFPTYLTLVFFSSRVLDRLFVREPVRDLAHFFLFGLVGLLVEWFLMELSPWSNPDANPILMLVFQLGMFSFWAIIALIIFGYLFMNIFFASSSGPCGRSSSSGCGTRPQAT